MSHGRYPRVLAEEPSFVGYHGTSRDAAKSLIDAGTFDPDKLGQRDHGFFGRGFYLATTKRGARFYSGILLEVRLHPWAKVLDGSDGSAMTPDHRPSYFDEFAKHYRSKIMRFRNDEHIADQAVGDMTPPFSGNRDVNRLDYYKYVTAWAKETGNFDAVKWGSEVVVVNPAAIASIRRTAPPPRDS